MIICRAYKIKPGEKIYVLDMKCSRYSDIEGDLIEKLKAKAKKLSEIDGECHIQVTSEKAEVDDTALIITIYIGKITETMSTKKLANMFKNGLWGMLEYTTENICKYSFYIVQEKSKEHTPKTTNKPIIKW